MRRENGAARYLPERELKLTEADDGQVAGTVALGAFALLATLFLGSQILTGKAILLARVYPIMGLVTSAFPALLAYSAAFLGIPAYRWMKLGGENEEIAQRNLWRQQAAQQLQEPSRDLRERLAEAADWAMGRKAFGKAVYDSGQASEVVTKAKETDDLEAFDRMLKNK
uniref:Uncharacterized protein n=1 Tax=Spumella elongata TaxID=89044 RepID=A0A7S3HN72_9STRA